MSGHQAPPLSLLVVIALALAACTAATPATPSPAPLSGTITVFAATSLVDVFTEMGARFEASHPGTTVEFNFAASGTLADDINAGAAADVFAPASDSTMAEVIAAGHATNAQQLATNSLVIVVPRDGDAVEKLADLANPGVRLVLAAPQVAAGQYARQAIKEAGDGGEFGADFEQRVLANVVGEEPDVQSVVDAARSGEADAAIVYVTDAMAAGDSVRSIEIPSEYNVLAQYPIAAVAGSSNEALARAFVDFVLSPDGQAILADHSFGPPATE
jgi:molybdate transport system substrate-binding protein